MLENKRLKPLLTVMVLWPCVFRLGAFRVLGAAVLVSFCSGFLEFAKMKTIHLLVFQREVTA